MRSSVRLGAGRGLGPEGGRPEEGRSWKGARGRKGAGIKYDSSPETQAH